MPIKKEIKERKRVIVEEVIAKEDVPEPIILPEAAKDVNQSEPESIVETKIPETKRQTVEVEPRKSPSIALWIIIPGIFLLGAILGGIVFYQRGVNKGEGATATPSASPTASSMPSSSPSATPNLSKYTISIFNGSGIAGEAAKAKTLLTTAGFIVGTTGNATTYDYTKTIIKAKSMVDSTVIQKIKDSLSKSYVMGDNQTLSSTATTDIQIIVGSSKTE